MKRNRSITWAIVFLGCWMMQTGWAQTPFELYNGDRVIFLGDGFFENEMDDGYIELALTTRWPDRTITFRNLGWSGDRPSGISRDHFTNPPTANDHLLEQIQTAEPTVAFICYGAGMELPYYEENRQQFATELITLIDWMLDQDIRLVLITPPARSTAVSSAVFGRFSENFAEAGNAVLEPVSKLIQDIGAQYELPVVDLFSRLQSDANGRPLTRNGIHLTAEGYQLAAQIIEDELGWPARFPNTLNTTVASGTLSLDLDLLPLPSDAVHLAIEDAGRGQQALFENGIAIASGRARDWSQGLPVTLPTVLEQVETLRQIIIQKNRYYFHQYRPQNETYLVGFRAYEQGQNASELSLLSPLIGERENEIGRLRIPRPVTLQLRPAS